MLAQQVMLVIWSTRLLLRVYMQCFALPPMLTYAVAHQQAWRAAGKCQATIYGLLRVDAAWSGMRRHSFARLPVTRLAAVSEPRPLTLACHAH